MQGGLLFTRLTSGGYGKALPGVLFTTFQFRRQYGVCSVDFGATRKYPPTRFRRTQLPGELLRAARGLSDCTAPCFPAARVGPMAGGSTPPIDALTCAGWTAHCRSRPIRYLQT